MFDSAGSALMVTRLQSGAVPEPFHHKCLLPFLRSEIESSDPLLSLLFGAEAHHGKQTSHQGWQ